MWVTCMLHNWCTDVYAQYGPWFSLPITAWSSFFSSSRSTLLSFLPRTSHSSSILFKPLLWVGTPWLLFLCPLQAGVVFICVCDPRPTHLCWTGWRRAFKGGWHWSRDGSCFLCLSCPSVRSTVACRVVLSVVVHACSANCTWNLFLGLMHAAIYPGPSLGAL